MNKEDIFNNLTKDIPNSKIYIDEPMCNHTSFKIGGCADIFIKTNLVEDVRYIIAFSKSNNIPLTIIGNGSNILVRDNGIRGITLQITINKIEIMDDSVIVGNGIKLGALSILLQKESLSGMEFACGIPGTIGGAIRMNAGAYGGEMKDVIEEVTVMTRDGKIKTLQKDDLEFSYRHSRFSHSDDIILTAKLSLKHGDGDEIKEKMDENLNSRREKQPIDMPNAGSIFKRGEDFISAKLIDDCGLKGYSIGGAEVSTKHAGFIVNTGNATAKDVIDLIEHIKLKVYEKFGKNLELELEIIGE